jgi:hypothetical protein
VNPIEFHDRIPRNGANRRPLSRFAFSFAGGIRVLLLFLLHGFGRLSIWEREQVARDVLVLELSAPWTASIETSSLKHYSI